MGLERGSGSPKLELRHTNFRRTPDAGFWPAGHVTSVARADELSIYRLTAAPKLAPADLGNPALCK
jgi:hypothetical protein